MKRLIINIVLVIISFPVFGQIIKEGSESLLDSLNQELKFIRDDSLKVQMLLQIADSYSDNNSDSSIYYSQEALQLARQINDIPGQMGAMAFIGEALIYKGNLPEALKLGIEAIEMGKNQPVRISGGVGPNYSNLGQLYMQIGNYKKALQYFKKMTVMGKEDIVGVAYGYYRLALTYENLNQLDSANFYLEKSYQTFGTLNYSYYPKIYDVYPPWYNLRAKIYLKQNKPDAALNDLYTALKMTLTSGDQSLTTDTYIDISKYYEKFNQIDSAVSYAENAFHVANKMLYTQGVLDASEILAKLYDTRNPAKALFYLKLAIKNRNKLYGAGNIQVMRDMIEQEEKKQVELEATKTAYKNRIKMNATLGITFTLFCFAIFLFIIIRRKQKAKQKIEHAYDQIKSTQAQLIQSEKMASLGELTAGIAHEIQNPLNFVNNFSEVNSELADELEEEIKKGNIEEVISILKDIRDNESKISQHGKKAESIVKGMLLHSRGSSGKKEPTDINALCDEYVRLAYHGFRAKDNSFNADYKLELDESLPKIEVVPQDFGRVLLNLINNAFYVVNEKAKSNIDGYKPEVIVKTSLIPPSGGGGASVSVIDNGPGIPDSIKDKIFQPFFTTKPTGQGTGLGLSLSYDIIKAHGGELRVETKKGEGSGFIIIIPV